MGYGTIATRLQYELKGQTLMDSKKKRTASSAAVKRPGYYPVCTNGTQVQNSSTHKNLFEKTTIFQIDAAASLAQTVQDSPTTCVYPFHIKMSQFRLLLHTPLGLRTRLRSNKDSEAASGSFGPHTRILIRYNKRHIASP